MEEIQKKLQLYREQVKSYSDFVIGLTKDYNMLFDEVKELRQAVMVPMFSKKGGHK